MSSLPTSKEVDAIISPGLQSWAFFFYTCLPFHIRYNEYMAKAKTIYVCQSCGYQSHKWQGKCFECGAFDSFQAETIGGKVGGSSSKNTRKGTSVKTIAIKDVVSSDKERYPTGIAELDQVLSGGFVQGQVVLLGGEPGIGKSTLILDVASRFNSLYVAGEESERQIKLRANRLSTNADNLELTRELEVHALAEHLRSTSNLPDLVIVDSIQSVYSGDNDSSVGSISQVQECATVLHDVAKETGVMMVIIGQITKGGNIAGPKQLEHLVDTVLYLEGSRTGDLRILRLIKNRFGATDEVGVFQMTAEGMRPADEVLKELVENRKNNIPGSVLTVILEGNRPLLLEVQALNTPAQYGSAQRVINGIPTMRAKMLLAVLERRAGIRTGDQDIYINLSGGLRIDDPAVDLPVCLAVASVVKDKPLPSDLVAFGEVGLLGEIKTIPQVEKRMNEAMKLGYSSVISPKENDRLAPLIKRVFTK